MRKLVIFDVDGTLVDSQGHIVSAMRAAFDVAKLPMPSRDAVLSIVGLSLPYAMRDLAPSASDAVLAQMVEAYKTSFSENRLSQLLLNPSLYIWYTTLVFAKCGSSLYKFLIYIGIKAVIQPLQ